MLFDTKEQSAPEESVDPKLDLESSPGISVQGSIEGSVEIVTGKEPVGEITNIESLEPIIQEVINDPIMDPFILVILGLLITSIFVSLLVCFYSKTLNRRPLIWFMISFASSLPTLFAPIGPMITFGILVYKGRLPSKEELEELEVFIQDFIALYEEKKHLAEKDVVMRTLYLRVKKDKNKTNKWEMTNALNSLVRL